MDLDKKIYMQNDDVPAGDAPEGDVDANAPAEGDAPVKEGSEEGTNE